MLCKWNETEQPYEGETAYELLEQSALLEPAKCGLVFEGKALTYATMMSATGQLAMHLRHLGAGHDKVVGLCVEKSVEEVCGMVGIIRSGAGYMPTDP